MGERFLSFTHLREWTTSLLPPPGVVGAGKKGHTISKGELEWE